MSLARALLVLLTGAAGLAESVASDSTLAVGLLIPTEPNEALSLRQGALLGVEHANRCPGVKVRLVVRGRPGQWGTEGDESAALALDEGVAGIITPSGGSAAHQVLQVAGRTRVLVVSLCADSSVTGAGVPWAVRIVPQSDEEAGALFRGIRAPGGQPPLRWGALVPAERAGREATRDLKTAAAAAGCHLLEPVRIASTHGDRPQLERLLTNGPDAILVWTDAGPAGELARALRSAGFQGRLAGPVRLRSEAFLRGAGAAAEGFVVPILAESSADMNNFECEFVGRFMASPDPLAVMSHDAVLLLAHILRMSAPDLACLSFPFRGTVPGASGPIRFDSAGKRLISLKLQVCQGGHFKPAAGELALRSEAGLK